MKSFRNRFKRENVPNRQNHGRQVRKIHIGIRTKKNKKSHYSIILTVLVFMSGSESSEGDGER